MLHRESFLFEKSSDTCKAFWDDIDVRSILFLQVKREGAAVDLRRYLSPPKGK